MIDQLTAQAICTLIFKKRGHHRSITCEDASALWMFLRKVAQQLSHAGCDPAIAAAPVKSGISSVKEKTIRLLQLVEVCGHRQTRAIEIFRIACRTKGLRLARRDHVHVVDPVSGLSRDPVRRCLVPLFVCQSTAQIEVFLSLRLQVNLEWHYTDHSIIHMSVRRDLVRALTQKWIEFFDQSAAQVWIVCQLGHGERAIT